MKHGLLILFLLFTSAAYAQPVSCVMPDAVSAPTTETPPAAEINRVRVNGYLLSLSWAPQYCRGRENDPRDVGQCGPKARFGFVLHGLWPEGMHQQDPAWCAPAKPLPVDLIRQNFCMTPSVALIQHEWAKHGTCMTDRPDQYFSAAARLYHAVRFPDMAALSHQSLTGAVFAAEFARINPGLRPAMLRLKLDRFGWLQEVRLCLGRSLKPRRCPSDEPGRADQTPLRIWRG
jgi:ribonuclease T2